VNDAFDDLSVPTDATAEESCAAGIDLERAVARLPAGARTVFVLHDVEGYRHAEIATMLGTSVGTSKAQLHRARRLLRVMLQEKAS
jgi:RNA polymerase sigma-70 factor (ECF subfamily)